MGPEKAIARILLAISHMVLQNGVTMRLREVTHGSLLLIIFGNVQLFDVCGEMSSVKRR